VSAAATIASLGRLRRQCAGTLPGRTGPAVCGGGLSAGSTASRGSGLGWRCDSVGLAVDPRGLLATFTKGLLRVLTF
jgi:hypothetical protein